MGDLGPGDTGGQKLRAGVLAAIAAGGALGAPARYGISRLIPAAPGGFPWATWWTNISGSLALGFLLIVLIEAYPPRRYLRPFFATGFLGAYTTFSTWMLETDTLIRTGHVGVGVTYLVASTLAGLGAAWLGIAAARVAFPRPPR